MPGVLKTSLFVLSELLTTQTNTMIVITAHIIRIDSR